ncbi:hypothetical protein B4107_2839 [Bacillus safensis]|nr:hypothetical protein B4107_2839 [Bacillus safensis]
MPFPFGKTSYLFCLHFYTSKNRANMTTHEHLGFDRITPMKKETK